MFEELKNKTTGHRLEQLISECENERDYEARLCVTMVRFKLMRKATAECRVALWNDIIANLRNALMVRDRFIAAVTQAAGYHGDGRCSNDV